MVKEVGTSNLLETWASNGTIVEPSLAKKENGWDLGEQPPYEYMNWILNILGQGLNHIFQNGVPLWNSGTTYIAGNIVQKSGTLYRAKAGSTNSEPPNNNWQAIGPYPVRRSIEEAEGFFQLVNDLLAPGNNKIYGTDAAGVKGWQPAPVQADGFKTGDIKIKYGSGVEPGFVRLNGLTIGNVGSVATELESADAEALFLYLWDEDPNITVSGGRGASAADDWAALKRITLPDARNRAAFFLDGMGGPDSDRITTALSGIDGKRLGAGGGAETVTLSIDEIPEHEHNLKDGTGKDITRRGTGPGSSFSSSGDGLNDLNTDPVGGGLPHQNMPPALILGTVYIKL